MSSSPHSPRRDIFTLRDQARADDYRNRAIAPEPTFWQRMAYRLTKPVTTEPECPKRLGHVPHHVDPYGVCVYCHHYVRVPSGG